MAKTARRKLKDKIKKVVDVLIKERDNYTCQHCGKKVSGKDCHVSHVVPVSATKTLEFDLLNLKILCFRHHIHWWHKNPLESGKWFEGKFPERSEYLKARRMEAPRSIKMYELRELYEELKNTSPLDKVEYGSGRIIKQPTPEEARISKEKKVDYSLKGRLEKHKDGEVK